MWEKAAPPCDRSSRGRPPGRRICLYVGGVGGEWYGAEDRKRWRENLTKLLAIVSLVVFY